MGSGEGRRSPSPVWGLGSKCSPGGGGKAPPGECLNENIAYRHADACMEFQGAKWAGKGRILIDALHFILSDLSGLARTRL
jgi:hypothetical protein